MHFAELLVLTLRASRPLSLSMGLAKARLARTAEAIREKKRMMGDCWAVGKRVDKIKRSWVV